MCSSAGSWRCSWHGGGTQRGPALAPARPPWPPWLFVTSVVAPGSGGWTRREGHCCPAPACWDPRATQTGAVTPSLVPVVGSDQHHPRGKLNHSPEGSSSHTNPFTALGLCPAVPSSCSPMPTLSLQGTGMGSSPPEEAPGGTGVPGDMGQLCLAVSQHNEWGIQPCFHVGSDHSSVTAGSAPFHENI